MTDLVILKRSKELGLNKYETKSYLSLLERETLSVAEIAKLAGIPRPAAYEALENLLAKGFCIARPGKVRQYCAVDPALLKEKALAALDESFDSKLSELDTKRVELLAQKESTRDHLSELYKEITPFYKNSRSNDTPLDYIEIIKNHYQIHNKFLELLSKTQREILAFNKPPFAYANLKQREEQYRLQDEAAERGVKKRIIYQMPPEDQVEAFFTNALEKFHEPTLDEARVIDELPIKLFIFDDRYCFFTLEDPVRDKASLTMVALEHEAMASSFRFLFESFWEKGHDHVVINNKKIYVDFKAKMNSEKAAEAEDK